MNKKKNVLPDGLSSLAPILSPPLQRLLEIGAAGDRFGLMLVPLEGGMIHVSSRQVARRMRSQFS